MNDLKHASPGRKYTIIGLVKNIRNIITKSNSAMGVVTIETFDGDLDIVLFSLVFNSDSYALMKKNCSHSTNPYLTLIRSSFSSMGSAANQRKIHVAAAWTASTGKPVT